MKHYFYCRYKWSIIFTAVAFFTKQWVLYHTDHWSYPKEIFYLKSASSQNLVYCFLALKFVFLITFFFFFHKVTFFLLYYCILNLWSNFNSVQQTFLILWSLITVLLTFEVIVYHLIKCLKYFKRGYAQNKPLHN